MNYIFMAANNTILDASKNTGFGQFLQSILSYVCLLIDSVVYFLVKVAYKLFLALAQFELFNDSAFEYLINRTYIVIGVISLFIVAYSLLNAIINPDNASKGNKSVTKIVKNIIIAIIGVAVMPTIFSYFYYFQKVVLCNNFIPRLILQQVNKNDTTTLNNTAEELPELIFESFFYPNKLESTDNSNSEDDPVMSEASGIKIEESNPKSEEETDTYTLAEAYDNAKGGMSFWKAFSPFIFSQPGVRDNSIQYLIILSTIAGGYIAYVFLNLCLDMGIRAVKLGYLELIAPLAIMTTIVPGQDGVFKNWSKKTISCAVEVFTRLFVVVFAVYLVSTIKDILQPSFSSTLCGIELNFVYILLLRAIIYFSIFAFAKQAPKFFSEATGIKSDGFKIGLLDKMKENGMAQAFGAMGGGITSGVRNGVLGAKNIGEAKGLWNKTKAAVGGFNSAVAGTASGMRRGWMNTKDIKKWSDIKEGAGKAADEAMEAKLKRDDYREKHKKNIPIIGGAVGSAIGHAKDAISSIGDWATAPEATYKHAKAIHDTFSNVASKKKALKDFATEQISKEENKSKLTNEAGESLASLEYETEKAKQKRDSKMKEWAALQNEVGDDSFDPVKIQMERIAADLEVANARRAVQQAQTGADFNRAKQNLDAALARQSSAYAKEGDFSKTVAGVKQRQENLTKALDNANEEFRAAKAKQTAAEKNIRERIENGEQAIIEQLSKDAQTNYINLSNDFRSAVESAQPLVQDDATVSSYMSGSNETTTNDVAKIFKDLDDAIVGQINQYSESVRKDKK